MSTYLKIFIKLFFSLILAMLVVQLLTQTLCISDNSFSNSKQENQPESSKVKDNPYKNATIDIKTYKVDTLGWGYDIYLWKSLYVHQPSIPALPGNRGFSEDSLARKAAEFVVWKIKNNVIPPSVSLQELDSLGVLK
jgi:hypothetical protein